MRKSVCFTGHRNVKITPTLTLMLNKTLTDLIEDGADDFYAGGALGWDMLCEQTILGLKEKFPHIKLHLVLPCSSEEQTSKWNDMQKSEYQRILISADTIEYTSEHYRKECMKERNRHLVELADCCVCYYDNRSRSGTEQTVRMAIHKGIMIINLAEIS